MADVRLEADQLVDEAWGVQARALSVGERRRLLVRADTLRTPSPATAYGCYRALQADLDPADAQGADRLCWLLGNLREGDAALETPARRAAAAAPGSDVWIYGHFCLACFEREAGRIDDAIRRLFDMLEHVAGRNDFAEGRAYANLALCLVQAGRDIESLVICRRAIQLLEGIGAIRPLLRARQILATLHSRFDAWEQFDAEVRSIEEAIAAMPPDLQAPLEHAHRIMMAGTSLERGAFAQCLTFLARIESDDPNRASWTKALRAYALTALDRAEESRAIVTELEALDSPPHWLPLWLETIQDLCSVALDPPAVASMRIAASLDRLHDDALGCAGNRTAMLLHIARALGPRVEFADLSKRAYDEAAGGLLERVAEVERFTRERPHLVELSREERDLLHHVRLNLLARYQELYRAVARLLEKARRLETDIPAPWCADPTSLAICAWCGSIRHGDGTWVAVGTMLPDEPDYRASHGICPACRGDHFASAGETESQMR